MKRFAYGLLAGVVLGASAPVFAVDAGPAPATPEVITVAPAVVEEMNKLVEQAIQVASGPLQTGDEFEPYAVLKLKNGSFQKVGWSKSEDPAAKQPPPMEIFRRIILTIAGLTEKNMDIVAAVTVAPTSVPTTDGKQRVSGIRAEVDHREGIPQIVFIPYLRENGKLIVGTPVYTPGTNRLFPHQQIDLNAPPAAKAAATGTAKPAGKPAAPAKPAK